MPRNYIGRKFELQLPELWEKTKCVAWHKAHNNPVVRIPLPSGRHISKSVKRLDSEYATLQKCIEVRDKIGTQLWGRKRWQQILVSKARTVAKHHREPASSKNGVHHSYRPKYNSRAWIAVWYEAVLDHYGQPTGKMKRRAKSFSYGLPTSQYATSEQAFDAAVEKRCEEEKKWYTVIEGPDKQRINE